MRATIVNLSSRPRDHWAVVTFPSQPVSSFNAECTFFADDGRMWRAVRGRVDGCSTKYRIYCTGMNAGERVSGKLINEKHLPADQFSPHPWVMDNVIKLLPQLGAKRDGVEKWAVMLNPPLLEDWSACHQRWAIEQRIPEWGLHFKVWADIYHNDPVVPYRARIVWSDRNDPSYNRLFENFAVRSGELMSLDFAVRHGASVPTRDAEGRWVTILNDAWMTMQDGSGLPMSGVILGSPEATQMVPPKDPEDMNDPVVRSYNNVLAAIYGPVVGACDEWDGHWLANRNVPRFHGNYQSQKDSAWETFMQQQTMRAGWFTARPVGLGKTPSQTGDQEDFGATKGTYVVTEKDPRHIRVLQYGVYAELFRGVNLYESTGLPLVTASHPQWVTWSGVTHYHMGVSPDRLGKSSVGPAGNGWEGYDDEHRSQNNMAAYLALTDDPMMIDQMAMQLEVDLASYRQRFPQYGQGAARAQGRLLQAFSQLASVASPWVGRRGTWIDMIKYRLQASSTLPPMNVTGPMKVLAWGGPDGRKQVYTPEGQLGPWASMWEHGLAVVGIYTTVKLMPENTVAAEVLRKLCETLKQFAFIWDGARFITVDDVLYSNGEAPPAWPDLNSRQFTWNAGIVGVGNWTLAGLMVAREFTGSTPLLDRYIDAATGGSEAGDRRVAEWWATVRSVR